jgi:hypothetical protein
MDEFAGERTPWDLDEHLNGCLAGYQHPPSYSAAVFFALEALWTTVLIIENRQVARPSAAFRLVSQRPQHAASLSTLGRKQI